MDVVSLIVPVYKVEKYLDECIESIVNQTYSFLDIILIDDGSPDSCGAICEKWARKDNRIRVYHRENGGISVVRNYGISEAVGKYISFVDSDDWIDERYVERLVEALEKTNLDVAMCRSTTVWVDEKKSVSHVPTTFTILNREQYAREFLTWLGPYAVVWNKLFRKSLLNDRIFESGRTFEDMYFTCNILQKVDNICIIPDQLYYYRMRKSSIINQNRNELCEKMKNAVDYLIESFAEEELKYKAKKLRFTQMLIYYVDAPCESVKKWKKQIRIMGKDLFFDKHSNTKYKCKLIFTCLFPIKYCKFREKRHKVGYQYFE